MNVPIDIHPQNSDVARALKNVDRWGLNPQLKNDLVQFLDALERGKVSLGKQISKRTQVKYVSVLRCPLIQINKPLVKITPNDLEQFDKELSTDSIKSEWGRPFSKNMKKDIRLALRTILKWRVGAEKAQRLTYFFDTRDVKKTPDYISEREIEKLYRGCKTPRERFLIAVLFDTGARCEEFLNIRYEDILMPEGKDNFVRITLKAEYSKTEGRTISLYWRHSLEAVRDFINERVKEGLRTADQVCPSNYDAVRIFLRRLGNRVLLKPINPHLFRHSSATYYATKLNRHELCYRYGWKFSSNMPDVYISRSGMQSKQLDEKFTQTEMGVLQDSLAKVEQENKMKDERLKHLERKLALMEEYLPKIADIAQNRPVVEIEAALRRKKAGLARM